MSSKQQGTKAPSASYGRCAFPDCGGGVSNCAIQLAIELQRLPPMDREAIYRLVVALIARKREN